MRRTTWLPATPVAALSSRAAPTASVEPSADPPIRWRAVSTENPHTPAEASAVTSQNIDRVQRFRIYARRPSPRSVAGKNCACSGSPFPRAGSPSGRGLGPVVKRGEHPRDLAHEVLTVRALERPHALTVPACVDVGEELGRRRHPRLEARVEEERHRESIATGAIAYAVRRGAIATVR